MPQRCCPWSCREFAVHTGEPKAEFGWKPGSITSIALKSGTNAYHGTANAFGRTDTTDARNPFLTGDQKQAIALENFGATFGGPIKKDKLFFFTGKHGYKHLSSLSRRMDPNALPIAGATTSIIKACNNEKAAGLRLSPTSLTISGLDANCNRTSGAHSIFIIREWV